jgi:hypothetical protein
MPYFYQLQNRQRAKRAVVAGGLLVGLFLLIGIAPARTLGWAGLGFGSLQVPQATVATAVEPVAVQVAKVRAPASLEPLTFPAYAEWSDIETTGDWSVSYTEGGAVDAVDQAAMSRLEQTSGVLPGAGNSSIYRAGSTAGGGSGGGGMGGGGGAGAGSASASGEEAQEAQAAQAVEETSSDDGQTASGEAATTQASRGNENGGAGGGGGSSGGDSSSSSSSDPVSSDSGSSDSGSSDSGSSDSGSSDSGSSDSGSSEREVARDVSKPPDLILSPIAPDAGPSAAASLPREVVQALVESPVGTETVHSAGAPETISAALDLVDPVAPGTDGDAEQDTVPEPLSLILVGLGLSAGLLRHRRAVR